MYLLSLNHPLHVKSGMDAHVLFRKVGRYARTQSIKEGVSNRWTGIWNGMMEWKMESNSEHTKLQLSRVTGTVQSSLK